MIVDKGRDIKANYNTDKNVYAGDCIIPLNPRSEKNSKMNTVVNIVWKVGFTMHKVGKDSFCGRCWQKY